MAKVQIELDNNAFVSAVSHLISRCAEEAFARGDTFKVGLSGGSLVDILAEVLPTVSTDWSKWVLFFCDERVVPFDNGDSTYGQYKTKVMGTVPLTEEQFIKIDPDLHADEAAKDYIKKMSVYFPPDSMPRFDLLLLGLGPDGHTCSLFPGHKLLNETSLWVCPINDSPKPPPCRITFTLPLINNARTCIFPVKGSGKAEIVKRILKDKEDLPATSIQPHHGALYWILDEGAQRLLD